MKGNQHLIKMEKTQSEGVFFLFISTEPILVYLVKATKIVIIAYLSVPFYFVSLLKLSLVLHN